jgi:eukaryotic-like serine/threonine-protein kinase
MTTLTATGHVIAGRYELTRFVAGGAMGEVWEAHDERMDRTVAVKVLRPEYACDPVAVSRFRTEAQLAARLAHPGIAHVHDVDDGASPNDVPWMVQEFVPGRPLREVVAATGGLDPVRAAGLIAQAADAVHAAHQAGVVHRDLTPGNLLVCAGDVVKITDFGIARAADAPTLTATGQVLGAAAYLSPEQVGGQPATAESDIYTLGVVLYECLTGARPFSGANPVEVARAHLHQEPPPLAPAVPEQLRAVTVEAMAKDPAARPSSAEELASRLREAVSRPPVSGPGPSVPWDWFAAPSGPAAVAPRAAARQTRALWTDSRSGSAPAVSSSLTAPSPPPTTPRRPMPSAPVASGAAAVRMATGPRPQSARAGADARSWWTGKLWRRHAVSRIGITGGAVILLVVLAVLWGGSSANAAPGIDMDRPGAGTVRLGGDAGKGE